MKNLRVIFMISLAVCLIASATSCSLLHQHTLTKVEEQAATCSKEGTKAYYTCECGKMFADAEGANEISAPEKIAMTAHTEQIVDGKAATCSAEGLTAGKNCRDCGKVIEAQEPIKKLNHSFTSYTANGDATCTSDGTKTAKCDNCSATDTVADVGSKVSHSFTDYKSDNNALCTKDGTKTAKCDNCPQTDTITDEGSKLAHDYSEKNLDEAHLRAYGANCKELMTFWYDCANCDANAKDDATATDKFFEGTAYGDHKVSKEWTTEGGYHFYECTVDGCDYIEGKAACADVLTDDDHKCDGCGADGVTSHVYGEWQKNDADTHKQICDCGDVKTEAHKWNDGVETTTPTHTSTGVKTYTCTVDGCGETKTTEIPAITDHTYNQKNTELKGALKSAATCKSPAIYYYSCICSELSDSLTFEDGETAAHIAGETVKENERAASCTEGDSYDEVVRCTVCNTVMSKNTVSSTPALGHQDTDGDLYCDNNDCDEPFYILTLDGATATVDTINSSTVANAFVAGEQITVVADAYKTVDGVKYMFVGFDKNTVDNRVGDLGNPKYTFNMPAENFTLTAAYAEANTTFLTTGTFKEASTYTPEGFTATTITDSTDADLEGLAGWSFIIPDNAAATASKTNNITGVKITAWGLDQEKTIKYILKNRGACDVTVEIAGEYFGYLCTTGKVTVPANSVVVAFMSFGPFSGAGSTCDFMLHVREDIGGDGSGTIQLDVVAAAAKTYENKVSDLIVTGGNYMQYGESADTPRVQSNQAAPKSSGMNGRSWDEYGVMYFYGDNKTTADTYARFRGDMLGDQALDLKTSGKFTIYVKVTNLYHAGGGKYSLVFTRGSGELSGSYLATKTIEFTKYGESFVYAIEIDPSVAGSSANLQLGLKKAAVDGTGGKVNVLVQIATENIFGTDPVN